MRPGCALSNADFTMVELSCARMKALESRAFIRSIEYGSFSGCRGVLVEN